MDGWIDGSIDRWWTLIWRLVAVLGLTKVVGQVNVHSDNDSPKIGRRIELECNPEFDGMKMACSRGSALLPCPAPRACLPAVARAAGSLA